MGESESIIRVEGLGKKYVIDHQQEGRGRYQSLRDTLMNGMRAAGRRLRRPFARTERREREEFWALKDVSFEVKRGEVVGIIGRNGAGKSTLLKILSRITEPTKGRVTLHGRVASLLEVGTGFHPELTGRENVYLNGAILGMSRAEIKKKFDEIVAFAEVEKFLDTPVKRYSSGMYMRLAFAVAAHLEPEILVVDEVLAVGDAEFQRKCLRKMEDVARGGRTVLFVSHNFAAVQALCNRVCCLCQGLLVGAGPATEQIHSYLLGAERAKVTFSTMTRLGPTLDLVELDFRPQIIVSGESANFVLSLRSRERLNIEDLCLLFYSIQHTRVAIMDLRRDEGPYLIEQGQTLTIQGQIVTLPLVEGSYQIGIYTRAGETFGDFYNLAELSIRPMQRKTSYAPYPAVHRGVIELSFKVSEFDVS